MASFISGCGLVAPGGCQAIFEELVARDFTDVMHGRVHPLNGEVAYAEAVERWARSTWDAYVPLHSLARRLD